MRIVFVNQDHARVGFYKSVLDEMGIPSFIRNEFSNNGLTEMPSGLFFPTLCVIDDEDYDEAMRILGTIYYGGASPLPDWICAKCQAEVPGNFDLCWQCGAFHENTSSS